MTTAPSPPPLYLREYQAACRIQDAEGDPRRQLELIREFVRICHEESQKQHAPCVAQTDEGEISCDWVESDLCSFCASTMFRDPGVLTSRGDAAAIPLGGLL